MANYEDIISKYQDLPGGIIEA
ncbi:MAG TPA: NADH-quinone oxidoreductase subunit E, partial [Syntrophomonas wolfei]|nr:NADH-quinone oxidoreductase subunit E [Syntrophomonas wolfei]